jgi:hypothetical protein
MIRNTVYSGLAAVLCALYCMGNHFAPWPQNIRPAHRRDLLRQRSLWGLSAWRQSFVEEEFARLPESLTHAWMWMSVLMLWWVMTCTSEYV